MMRHNQDKQCTRFSFLCRVSLLLLGLLLSWSDVGYSGGPTFSQDVRVESFDPDLVLVNLAANEADWVLSADEPVDQAFAIQYNDGQGDIPALVIENRAPNNALYIDGSGNVGLGTAAPARILHIAHFAPTILFEDNNSSGPQTWALSANELNFAVSDLTNADTPFIIDPRAGDAALQITAGGNIGMGTRFPEEAVDVVRSEAASRFQLTSFSSAGADAAQFIQRRARGTEASPAAVQTGDNLGLFSFRGMRPNGAFSGSQATITAQATQDWTNTARGTNLVFGTTQNGTSAVRSVMEITHDGRVLINGSQLNVPDYVFAEDYELMPLDELKAYIAEHDHLPEVASEAEVQQSGVDLGGTQMALLKKIEELTLYTLEQHEELGALRTQNRTLQHQLSATTADLAQQLAAQDAALVQQAAEFAQRLAVLEQDRGTHR